MLTCSHEIMFCNINDPLRMNKTHLGQVLCFFVSEVCCRDGGEYEACTLYDIIICLQFHFERASLFWHLIDDLEFTKLKWTLDNMMKAWCSEKLGTVAKAKPISFEDKNVMWASSGLGKDTPDKLRNTVMFLLGILCALCGGEEHRRLHCPPHNPQIVIKKDGQGQDYLVYTEDSKSKTFQGGLYSRVKKAKVVPIHGNRVKPERDIIGLYQKYVLLLPPEGKNHALYKFSLSQNRVTPAVWYTDKPLRVNSLKTIVKKITAEAGIKGNIPITACVQ